MAVQIIQTHATMASMQNQTVKAASLDELRADLLKHLGPFPLLFEAPGSMDKTTVPGIVVTAIVDIPGADERGGPFLGAQMLGYVPAAKGVVGDGTKIVALGIIKTPAYFERTVPTTVERPFDPDAPQPQGQS